METEESVQKAVEDLCTNPNIPWECQPAFDEFRITVAQALKKLDREIYKTLG